MWSPDTRYGRAVLRRKLGVPEDAPDMVLRLAIRGVQRAHGLPPTGEADEAFAALLGDPADADLPPEWWVDGMTRDDLLTRFGLADAALRRLEGQHGVTPGQGTPSRLALLLDRAY